MQIKHIFFDLDHTLWDFEANSAKTFQTIFIKNNMNIDNNQFLQYYKPINMDYWKLFRENKVSKSDLKYRRLKDTFDALDFKISDDLINKLAIDYIRVLPTFNEVFEGTYDILNYLKPKYKLHIITNGFSEIQATKLKNSKLDGYFEKIITSESVGVKKPNPEIFAYALKTANAQKKESVMIGDSWEADIIGAKNFGILPIYCNFENQPKDSSVLSIERLLDLKKHL